MVYVKSNLQSSSPYRAPDLTGQCTRNGEPAPCGVYFPVTDYLGKVVVLLDSNGKVAGTGEYEPFGHVNRVTYLGETPHPYPASAGRVVGYLKHPVLSGTTSILRARYPLVRTDASAYAQRRWRRARPHLSRASRETRSWRVALYACAPLKE